MYKTLHITYLPMNWSKSKSSGAEQCAPFYNQFILYTEHVLFLSKVKKRMEELGVVGCYQATLCHVYIL
jgi:hypothetical protein